MNRILICHLGAGLALASSANVQEAARDPCGMDAHADYVGRELTWAELLDLEREVEIILVPSRVSGTDYRAERLNIYVAQRGNGLFLVQRLGCG